MVTIQFYHLTATPLERALPRLLEKAYGAHYRTLLLAESEERVEQLNNGLWTHDPASFLPHGTKNDGHAATQPILLATDGEPLNNANLWVITDGRVLEAMPMLERVLDIFDGNDEAATARARQRWSLYKTAGASSSPIYKKARQNAFMIDGFDLSYNGGWITATTGYTASLSPYQAYSIDSKIDDGTPETGKVQTRGNGVLWANTPTAGKCISGGATSTDTANVYNLTYAEGQASSTRPNVCTLFIDF